MLVLRRRSARELIRHPDSGGWIEWWDVAEEWGTSMPLAFVPNAASRTWATLERRGLIEYHSKHGELVRPRRTTAAEAFASIGKELSR